MLKKQKLCLKASNKLVFEYAPQNWQNKILPLQIKKPPIEKRQRVSYLKAIHRKSING